MDNEIKVTEQLASYADTATNLMGQVERAELANMEDCAKLGDLTKICKAQFKKLEDDRKSWVKPLNEQVKRLNGMFKIQQEPFTKIEKIAKDKIGKFMAEEEERQEKIRKDEQEKADREALAAATKASASGDEAQADAILDQSIAAGDKEPEKAIVRGNLGSSTSTRSVWKHEVVDPGKVPSKYMMVDESAIKAAVKNGERDIPGIRIYEDKQVVIR